MGLESGCTWGNRHGETARKLLGLREVHVSDTLPIRFTGRHCAENLLEQSAAFKAVLEEDHLKVLDKEVLSELEKFIYGSKVKYHSVTEARRFIFK